MSKVNEALVACMYEVAEEVEGLRNVYYQHCHNIGEEPIDVDLPEAFDSDEHELILEKLGDSEGDCVAIELAERILNLQKIIHYNKT